jgi:nicotinamidase-related amidase
VTDLWSNVIPQEDLEVFAAAGYGGNVTLGSRPALLIVDVTYAFTGSRPMPVLEAVRECRTACGETAWSAVEEIRQLRETAHATQTPVFYTRARPVQELGGLGQWAAKSSRAAEDMQSQRSSTIVAELSPQAGDHVLEKSKPSAFFGTDLLSLLVLHKVDTLVVTGGAASGCVRATVIDAFSYNFPVAVVPEATFDRSELVRAVNLFDLHVKYANLMSRSGAQEYLVSCTTASKLAASGQLSRSVS